MSFLSYEPTSKDSSSQQVSPVCLLKKFLCLCFIFSFLLKIFLDFLFVFLFYFLNFFFMCFSLRCEQNCVCSHSFLKCTAAAYFAASTVVLVALLCTLYSQSPLDFPIAILSIFSVFFFFIFV